LIRTKAVKLAKMALGDLMSSRQMAISVSPTPGFQFWNLLPYITQVVVRKGFRSRIRNFEFGNVSCVEGTSAGAYDIRGYSIHTHRFIARMSNDSHKQMVNVDTPPGCGNYNLSFNNLLKIYFYTYFNNTCNFT
jgi:hypothetical protein